LRDPEIESCDASILVLTVISIRVDFFKPEA